MTEFVEITRNAMTLQAQFLASGFVLCIASAFLAIVIGSIGRK